MRKTIVILIAGFFLSFSGFAQGEEILKAIGKKDLSKLEQLMNEKVDFCLNSGQKSVSKTQAISSTMEFLNTLNIKSARKIHTGESKVDGTYYDVGKLKADQGTYRIFIYYEKERIVEFRIDDY